MSRAPGGDSALAEPQIEVQRPQEAGKQPRRPGLAFCSDERLARRAAGGDAAAFDEIFRRYQQDLYRFCVGILREPQDAEDAVQNTMVKALRALPGETRTMQLKPWLYRIAHNEAVELRRRARPVEPLSLTVDDTAAGTEERAEQEVRLKTLLADIADLPERQRASLVMRELNGLGFGEIGAALGTSPGAVRQALYEARRGLTQMESGRDMDCDAAMEQVSDADGSPTRRGIRAHLRGCLHCRRFQAEMRDRRETLAAISPMPALAVAALAKGAVGGSGVAAGGASALAGGAGAGVGGIGVGGAGAIGVSGLVKGAAGLIAVLALGTVAVDRGGILRPERDPAGPEVRAAAVRGVEPAPVGSADAVHRPTSGRQPVIVPTGAEPRRAAATTDRVSVGATMDATDSSSPAVIAHTPGRSPDAAPGAVPGPLQAKAPAAPPGNGDTGSSGAVPVAGADSGVKAQPEPPEKVEPRSEKAEAESEKVEARAEKTEVKAEQSEAKAGAKAEKSEAKAEAKSEKAEAKAEEAEAKEHPQHPAESEGSAAETAPAAPVDGSSGEAPIGFGEEAPHGEGAKKKAAEPSG